MTVMRYWWVNHKQTFDHEVGRGYIWCPKRKQNGSRNHFYETLREVQRGDLVFSFAHAHLQAVGPARFPCYSCPRPDEFGKVGELWDLRGWRVDVAFQKFYRPLKITAVADKLAPLLPRQYSPIQSNGYGNQGAYLAEIPAAMARTLLELADHRLVGLMEAGTRVQDSALLIGELAAQAVEQGRSARFGVQVVCGYHHTCALTGYRIITRTGESGVEAAHIEPWAKSRNDDVHNGLALSRNVHWAFDRGLWSVDDQFRILVQPERFQEWGPGDLALAKYHGQSLQFAPKAVLRPKGEYLRRHRHQWGF